MWSDCDLIKVNTVGVFMKFNGVLIIFKWEFEVMYRDFWQVNTTEKRIWNLESLLCILISFLRRDVLNI